MSEPICFSLFAQFNGLNGFLGYRGSLMLDVVFLAMFAVVPVMFWSIYQVRYHRRYALHKTTQLILAAVLLVAVTLFEIEMRINGWMDRAVPSRFWRDGRWTGSISRHQTELRRLGMVRLAVSRMLSCHQISRGN